jgi:hypothetical protein
MRPAWLRTLAVGGSLPPSLDVRLALPYILLFWITGCSDSGPVAIATGSIRVFVSTAWTAPDPNGYTLTLCCRLTSSGDLKETKNALGIGALVEFDNLPTGKYTLTLGDLAPNCWTQINPQTVTISDVVLPTEAGFMVSCPAGTLAGTWTRNASMPTLVGAGVAASVAGILYVATGQLPGVTPSIVGTVTAYDPVSDSWTTKASIPTPRAAATGGVANGILYIAGGGSTAAGTGVLEAYDPATNTWAAKASMPTPRLGASAGVINGILYVIGGYSNAGPPNTGPYLAAVEAYDPTTNTWTTKAPMPTPRENAVSGVVNGILYVAGGNLVHGTRVVEAYDPVSNTWSTKSAMPTQRGGATGGVMNGILYVVGSTPEIPSQPTIETYDPVTDTWTTIVPTPQFTFGDHMGAVIGSVLYVAGITNEDYPNTLHAFRP